MIQTLPLALPASLVDLHRIDLSALYSTGWGVEASDVVGAPNGEVYALYLVYRHTHGVARDEPDPAKANFGYRLIARYSAGGELLASAVCCAPDSEGNASAVLNGSDMTLCVLPDGTLAVSGDPDSTTLITPDLNRVVAGYEGRARRPFEEVSPDDAFASSISVTPSGRLLCATTEYGVWDRSIQILNLVGVADGALTSTSKPAIEALAVLGPARKSDGAPRAHVRYRGRPVDLENRPRPALTERVTGETSYAWDDSRLGRPVPLAEDLFVVPFFARTFRSGSRGQPFAFALVNGQGEMTGRLQGLHEWNDSPFTGSCFAVAADPRRGRAFHLNRYGLYAWGRDGVLRARLDTQNKAFTPLTRFTLTACSPAGDLLLVHRKQHLVLCIPAPDDLGDLASSVEQALRTFARQRTALKGEWSPVNWHWTHTSAARHL
ncbi:hypothetical protein QNO07_22150 [Streptomyces sp. 549]|uniref:hypothetical protein n=1 Tax=Streptomyces sp. 549 TaxID=3049076 RepID=UPI0024C2A890|nr:hypothetical protein [Streptomyces sp. 549]MDK1476089.1 hypothetical protein [Streptomyces sp. 549]